MSELSDAFQDAADEVAALKREPGNRYWWLYGTIQKKNSNGTLDVMVDGVTIQQVKATVSCMMASVFERVVILKAGPIMTCVDVIAGTDSPKIPSAMLPEAMTTRLGGVMVGDGLSVTEDGVLSVDNSHYVKQNGIWSVFRIGNFCTCSCVWRADKNAVITSAWGVLYESTDSFSPPDFPVTFSDIPATHIDYVLADPGTYYAALIERDGYMTTTNVGKIWLVRPNSGITIGHPRFAITASGWV